MTEKYLNYKQLVESQIKQKLRADNLLKLVLDNTHYETPYYTLYESKEELKGNFKDAWEEYYLIYDCRFSSSTPKWVNKIIENKTLTILKLDNFYGVFYFLCCRYPADNWEDIITDYTKEEL